MIILQSGTIDITENCWSLCPNGEKEKTYKSNPNVQVIEYEGESVTGYAKEDIKNIKEQLKKNMYVLMEIERSGKKEDIT